MTDRLNETIDRSHRGRFRIPADYFERMTRRELSRLFAVVYPVHVEMRYDMNCIEYVAISRLFEAVEEACDAPFYEMCFDGTRWSANKLYTVMYWTQDQTTLFSAK